MRSGDAVPVGRPHPLLVHPLHPSACGAHAQAKQAIEGRGGLHRAAAQEPGLKTVQREAGAPCRCGVHRDMSITCGVISTMWMPGFVSTSSCV